MGTAAALLEWAHEQIGVTEAPPGSNHVRYWDDVGMSGAQGQPWCAAFVLAGLTATHTAPVTRSVYVPQIRLDYQHAGLLHPVNDGQPGDQVIYNIGQGHTGILVSVDRAMRTIRAIEGNTSSDQHGQQDNGGGVYLRTRPWGPIRGVGRPPFDAAPTAAEPATGPTTTPFPGEHMHRVDITNVTLDADGNGWVTVANTDASKVVSIIAQGAYPPLDRYWNLPVFGRQQRGADTIVQISEADARAVEQLSVWVAD